MYNHLWAQSPKTKMLANKQSTNRVFIVLITMTRRADYANQQAVMSR